MTYPIIIAHAHGEEDVAEQLAIPLRETGYDVSHRGTVLVGESVTEEASKSLSLNGPVILCGTVCAMGTGWAHRIVNAARAYPEVRIYAVQMEKEAHLAPLSLESAVLNYWQDSTKAISELITALKKHYPIVEDEDAKTIGFEDYDQALKEFQERRQQIKSALSRYKQR